MHNHTAAVREVALASLFNIRAEAILPPCFVELQKLELSLFYASYFYGMVVRANSVSLCFKKAILIKRSKNLNCSKPTGMIIEYFGHR